MHKMLAFARKNYKEFIRDPLSLIFGAAFPVIFIILIQIICKVLTNKGIAVDECYNLSNQLIGISVFSFSFASIYAGISISRDKESLLLQRYYNSEMGFTDYYLGYALPLLLVSFLQSVMCMATAFLVNAIFNVNALHFSIQYVIMIAMLVPIELLFINIGLMLGSSFKIKKVIWFFFIMMILIGLTSNVFFDVEVFGKPFKIFSAIFPFYSSVVSLGNFISGKDAFPLYFIVLAYSILSIVLSIIIFKKKMNK